jgi:hypothetical protein
LLSLILIARNTARANVHVVIQFCDISITKGLQESIEARLPAIVGGLSLALACSFSIITPESKHPATK